MKPIITSIVGSIAVFLVFCFVKDGWDARTWPNEQQVACGLTMALVCIFSAMFASEKS